MRLQLANFPVLITLNSGNIDYSLTQGNGQDLRFFDANGAALAYQVERWDEAGDSFVWVRVPQITTSGSDQIVMYYGNAVGCRWRKPVSGLGAGYSAVYHLGESGTAIADSSANAFVGAATNGPASATSQIGAGQQLDGVDDYVNLGSNRSFVDNVSGATLSVWVNPASVTGPHALVSTSTNNGGVATGVSRFALEQLGSELRVIVRGDDTSVIVVDTTSSPLAIGNWSYISVSVDLAANTVEIWVNGVLQSATPVGAFPSTLFPNAPSASIALGASDEGGPGINFAGLMDEARIARVAQTAAWQRAEYLNMTGAFVSVGAATSAPTDSGVLANDSDLDSTMLSAVLVSGPMHSSSFSLNADGTFSYTPVANYNGADSFVYRTSDGVLNSANVTVSITINPVNDAPVLNFVEGDKTFTEGFAAVLIDTSATVNDVDLVDFDTGSLHSP